MTEREQIREELTETKAEHGKAKAAKVAALAEHRRLMTALEAAERSIRIQHRRHA